MKRVSKSPTQSKYERDKILKLPRKFANHFALVGLRQATVFLKAGVAFLWRFLTVAFLETSLLCEALVDLSVFCIAKDEQLIQKPQSYSKVSFHATSTGILSGKKSFLKCAVFCLWSNANRPFRCATRQC